MTTAKYGKDGRHIYGVAHYAGHQEIVLDKTVGNIECGGRRRYRQRNGQGHQAHYHAGDRRTNHRYQVKKGDQQAEQYRVRDAENGGPEEGTQAGHQRCEQVAEQVTPHAGQHLVG